MCRGIGNTSPSEGGEALAKSVASSTPATFDDLDSPGHWYAAYRVCRHEKSVARHMGEREIESFLPIYRAQHCWKDGSRRPLELRLFSDYIFVRIRRNDRVKVLGVPGVLSSVGAKNSQPRPLLDREIEALRSALGSLRSEPYLLIFVWQRVRIRAGALSGMTAVIVRKRNSLRVVLTLELLMQSIDVEVNGVDLEALDSECTGKRGVKHSSDHSLRKFGYVRRLEPSSNSPQSQNFPLRQSMGRMGSPA